VLEALNPERHFRSRPIATIVEPKTNQCSQTSR
jgi:hypothetical protein